MNKGKRFITGVVTLLVGPIAVLLLTMQPAAASASTQERCNTWRDVPTCVWLDFRDQDDGDGTRLEGFHLATNRNCGSLEPTDKYKDVKIQMTDKTDGGLLHSYNYGVEGCDFFKDMEWAGRDKGCVRVRVDVTARFDGFPLPVPDRHEVWIWDLCPNPTRSDWISGYTNDNT